MKNNQDNHSSEDNNRNFGNSYPYNQGIAAIIDQTLSSSYEKLPMMHVIIEKLKMLLSTNLRNFTSESVEIESIDFKYFSVSLFCIFLRLLKT